MPNLHNIPVKRIKCFHNAYQSSQMAVKHITPTYITLVERGRCWTPPLAPLDARSLHELHTPRRTQITTSGFPLCLYLCSPDYVCPQLSYAGCPGKKVISAEDVLPALFQCLNCKGFPIPSQWKSTAGSACSFAAKECRNIVQERDFWQQPRHFSLGTVSLMNN